ncbi:MAG: DUF4230 domain-containing protein, partial [Candidatus Levybacteria bacterium]|nr:DUF4230 domain-containing protein [Candidatus Levybacteria bacterium]
SMQIKIVKYVLFGIVLLLVLLGVWYIVSFFKPKQQYTYNMSSQTVIKELRSLNRLETASFTIEKIIDAGTSGNAFQQFLYGDQILLIAHGQIIAGIDLSKMKDNDVQISGQTIVLKLPAPEILVTTLDNGQTRVYDRRQGLLSKGDKNLESNARKVAIDTITDAACKGNILQNASDNAKKQLTAFLKALGFTTITIEISEGSC